MPHNQTEQQNNVNECNNNIHTYVILVHLYPDN